MDLYRLPELICGFHRRSGDSPTLYPVACAPQTWSAGAVYLPLPGMPRGTRGRSGETRVLSHAVLPEDVDWMRILNLSIGSASVDLLLARHASGVGVTVLRREGELEILSVK